MKMYVDYTVEGTPEEVAAFKHIDAALAARNHRAAPRAIEGPKQKPKKVVSKRVQRKPRAETNAIGEQIEKLIGAKNGVTTRQISEYLELPVKTVYNHLYRMVKQNKVVRDDAGLYHRVPQPVPAG